MAKQLGILRQQIRFSFTHGGKILYFLVVSSSALVISTLPRIAFSQKVQLSKLEIPAGATYNLEADTILVDELVLGDSCKVNLVKHKAYIKANRTVIGA